MLWETVRGRVLMAIMSLRQSVTRRMTHSRGPIPKRRSHSDENTIDNPQKTAVYANEKASVCW